MTGTDRALVPWETESSAPNTDRVLLHHPHFLAADARDYVRLARHAAEHGELESSLRWYHEALRFWNQANEKSAGRWRAEQEAANREFAEVFLGRRGERAGYA
ncbi:MAG: hypothetical protein IH608_03375 [Proteobacteria bacterium]|nr:hypothetical protein [Pseudomonadota bacterium]